MIDKIKISVAMASYNGAKYISEQINSILNQTIIPHEIIICDDNSTDKTLDIIKEFQQKYPDKIKIFVNENNLGVSKNFEKAISLCSGDIIFLSDQDDVWLKDKIEKLSTIIIQSPTPIGAFCNSKIVDKDLNYLNSNHWQSRGFSNDLFDKINDISIFNKRVPVAGHDMAFNSQLREILLPFPDLKECHDTWIGLVLIALNLWDYTNEELTLFRQHNENVSNSGSKKSIFKQFKEAKNSVKNNTFLWTANLYQELITRVKQNCPDEIIITLQNRQNHSLTRSQMNCNIFKRLPLILQEIKNNNYNNFARNYKSIIQDLFLR